MKHLNLLLAALMLVIITSCKPRKTVTYEEGSILGKTVSFKIVQLNDVYEIAPISGGLYGGMARVAYIRDSIKETTPNTYMVLAGDFLNPSLLSTIKYEGKSIQGRQMVDVMNAMDFDLVTFGNHEFDLKEEDLLARLDESKFAWTSANVQHVTDKGNVPFYYNVASEKKPIPTHYIIDVPIDENQTLPVGFFSVTINSTPQDYVHYKDYYYAAQEAYQGLQEKAEVILGLTHVSLDQDKQLAESMEKVPLIMGGHEHFNMLVPTSNGTIAKADANAKTVYVHTIQYNLDTKETNVYSKLVHVNDKVGSQPETEQVVAKWQKILETELKEFIDDPNEIIYHAEEPLDGTDEASRSKQTNLGALITKAMAAAYNDNLDAVVVNGGSIRIDDMIEGNVSSTDVFRILPFGGSIIKVDIKGDLLVESLDYTETKSGTGAYLQRYNIEYKNGNWHIANKPIESDKIYQIAMTDFLITGYDIPFLTPKNKGLIKVYEPKEDELASDVRTAIIEYLKSNK